MVNYCFSLLTGTDHERVEQLAGIAFGQFLEEGLFGKQGL
jgi:hypothetical protein